MEDSVWQLLLSVCVGISLSAACGFRVFVPLLVLSCAVKFFGFPAPESFTWIGSWTSFSVLATATVCEIFAYYIPWFDHVLDVINAPLAFIAGTVVLWGLLPESQGCLKWGLAAVVGGGLAETVHVTNSVVRGASSATTGGLGNNVVSSGQNVAATGFSIMAFVAPIIACIVVLVLLVVGFFLVRKFIRFLRNRRRVPAAA